MKKNLLILTLCTTMNAFSLVSLNDMNKRANELKENPPIDGKNLINPDYTSYHQSITPGKLKNLFTTPITNQFKHDLLEITKARVGAQLKGEIIGILQCTEGDKIFVFSDIQAGFHSFLRSIHYLIEQHIISKDLVIQPHHFIVLNSDTINYGPYNIETLLLIFSLLQKNPDSFIYIRGKQESSSEWINGGLKRELITRFNAKGTNTIPLQNELNQFFDTLPLAIYIHTVDDPHNYICISLVNIGTFTINESLVSSFLTLPTEKTLSYFNLKTQPPVTDEKRTVDIIAVIQTEDWRRDFKGINGLGMLGQTGNATAWSTLSTPIQLNQQLLHYYWDAFLMVTIHNPLSKSTITLYNHDSRSKDPFKKISSFNIVSTVPVKDENNPSDSQNYYHIGSSVALKQGLAVMGQRINRGITTRINKENNEHGGVNNTILQPIVYNDNYDPAMARHNIITLKDKNLIDIILTPQGSPTLGAYLDYIRDNKIAVLFPITGAPKFRDPDLKGIIHYRSSYADEVNVLINYMITTKAVHKFAFFYQDDDYGQGPLKAAHEILEKLGIKDFIDVPYQRSSVNYSQQVQKIKDFQPEAIGFFSASQATIELIRELGVDFLTNKQMFGISFLGEESFRRFVRQTGLTVLLGAVVPNPKTSTLEIVQEYRKEMDKANYLYDVFSLEAYIGTSILIDVMKKIEGPITKDKIMKQLESLNNYSFKGLNLTFHPQHRDLTEYVWIESGDNEEWNQYNITKNGHTADNKTENALNKKDDNAQNTDISRPDQVTEKPTNATP